MWIYYDKTFTSLVYLLASWHKTLMTLLRFHRAARQNLQAVKRKKPQRDFYYCFKSCHIHLQRNWLMAHIFQSSLCKCFLHSRQHLKWTFTSTGKDKIIANLTGSFTGLLIPENIWANVSVSHTGCVICSLRIVTLLLCVNWVDHRHICRPLRS